MSYSRIPAELRSLKQCFTYNSETGELFYKDKLNNRKVGYLEHGYLRATIGNGKMLYVHQIAFALMTGEIPNEVDHIDKNGMNNKWNNLRAATHIKNATNVFKRKTNKSGLKGVSWAKSNNCWRMDITYNKVKYYSYHKTKEEAYEAYCKKSAEFHKEFGCVE